jgi:NAD(P)H dehydrogenase (quinone)
MTVALTGGSGNLGRLTTRRLLEQLDPADIVVATRDPSKLTDLAARGVRVRAADFDDPGSLRAAFAGVDRLLIISGDAVGQRVEQHTRAIDAAAASGVGQVLYTSIVRPEPDNPILVIPDDHRRTEEHVQASGLAWTALRNSCYTDTLLGELRPALAGGTWFTNKGNGRAAYVTRADCARAAAAVLARGGHENTALDVTGPEALTAPEVGRIAAEVTGRALTVVEVDDETAAKAMVGAGLPEPAARVFASFSGGIRQGWLDVVSQVVPGLTGQPATSVREFLQANRQALLAG